MPELRVPAATYRVQLNAKFTFNDARAVIPYLAELGITDLYASPVTMARPGSNHGYDVIDPGRLNPELGTEDDFAALIREIKQRGMGLLLDIVPNHLAADAGNPRWMDLLENGRRSCYAAYFDVDWRGKPGNSTGKILLPVLRKPYRQALCDGDFRLALTRDGLFITYFDYRFPVNLKSSTAFLTHNIESLRHDAESYQVLKKLVESIKRLPARVNDDREQLSAWCDARRVLKDQVWETIDRSDTIRLFVRQNLEAFNGIKGDPASFSLLDSLLKKQAYYLTSWKAAHDNINFRRFFDVNDLVGVREENIKAFKDLNALTLRLIRENKITGVRIDHIDGLYDPLQYLLRLKNAVSNIPAERDFYIVVEKILEADETLPADWPVYGTTGYDFLNTVNALFVDTGGLSALGEIYRRFTGLKSTFAGTAYDGKRRIIKRTFTGEIAALALRMNDIASRYLKATLPHRQLEESLSIVTACLPVYRTYIHTPVISHADRTILENSFKKAEDKADEASIGVLDTLKRVLLLDFPPGVEPDARYEWLRTVMRWQQLTGAVMAKGFEDTALYNYNRLLSLNDVGADPEGNGFGVAAMHGKNLFRQTHTPHTLNATATHDTKRGEDVRARLNVLSEIPGEWETRLKRWRALNAGKKMKIGRHTWPDPNTEVFLYQTLLGAWPLNENELPEFRERIKAYMLKAVREAKAHTSWTSPDEAYEKVVINFVGSILDESDENGFLTDFREFARKIGFHGAINALSQLLIKIASPGAPDFYQGTELWNLTLVDPDNRRQVDFKKMTALLGSIIASHNQDSGAFTRQLLNSWPDGRIKMFVTYRGLTFRRAHANLFRDGEYIPLSTSGEKKENVFAFAWRLGNEWVIVAVPRFSTRLAKPGVFPMGRVAWGGNALRLPGDAPEAWSDVFTGQKVNNRDGGLDLAGILQKFPVAMLGNSV